MWEARQYEHEAFARSSAFRSTGGVADSAEAAPCDPHVFVGGECRGCGLRGVTIRVGGELRTGAPPTPGGFYDARGRLKVPKPRAAECEHKNHVPFEGQLKCLDCGSVGM